MNSKELELTPQQYKKYNGQSIMSALSSMGKKATLEELSKHIAQLTNQAEEYVRTEVLNVLDRGLNDGFLLKHGQFYVLPSEGDFEVDFTPQNRSLQKSLQTESGELGELKQRQELRNQLELSLFKMSLPQLRQVNLYVNKFEGNKKGEFQSKN